MRFSGKKYPYNFAYKVLEGKERYKDIMPYRLEECLSNRDIVTEREEYVIHLYFEDGLTYLEVGEKIGVGPERVRQIIQKAIRKLRRVHKMWLAIDFEEYANVKALLKRYQDNFTLTGDEDTDMSKRIIEELNLSIRPYNCMLRSGHVAIKDFHCLTIDKMMRIRNLGKNSCAEMVEKLCKYGFILKSLKDGKVVSIPSGPLMDFPDDFYNYYFEWPIANKSN